MLSVHRFILQRIARYHLLNISPLIFLLLSLQNQSASAKTIRVDPVNGRDINGCGTSQSVLPCHTITFAVSESVSGDTILLASGVYDCAEDGNGVRVYNSSLIIQAVVTGGAVIDCRSKPRRALWYIDSPAVVSGVSFRNGNNTDGGGAIRIDMTSHTTNTHHQIEDCSFVGHSSGGIGGAAVDVRFKTQTNGIIANNLMSFDNCSFFNNGGSMQGSDVVTACAAGAVSITYHAGAVQNNRNIFTECAFVSNVGGSYAQVTGGGAVTVAVLGHINNNTDIFVNSVFIRNQGGISNGVSGAGAISLLLFSNFSTSYATDNSQVFNNCSISNNVGSSENAYQGSVGSCGSGGICIAIISMTPSVSSSAIGGVVESRCVNNRQVFTGCTIVSNSGGNSNGVEARSGGVSGAAGVSVLISSAMQMDRSGGFSDCSSNRQTFSSCSLDSNLGGEYKVNTMVREVLSSLGKKHN